MNQYERIMKFINFFDQRTYAGNIFYSYISLGYRISTFTSSRYEISNSQLPKLPWADYSKRLVFCFRK